MWKILMCSLALCSLLPELVLADPNPSPNNNINISGYVDGSYNYLLRSNKFISGYFDRYNDVEENGFTLHQAAITIAKQPPQGFGGLINLMVGSDANQIASYGMNPNVGIQNVGFDIPQLFLQYTVGKFTVVVGKLIILVGTESFDPTQDVNFSRSFLAGFAQPSSVTGVRGTYAINEKVSLIAGLNNGYDTIRDTSRQKTIELGIACVLNPMFSFNAQGYSGEARSAGAVSTGPTGRKSLFDIYGTMNATNKLSFIANYDYGVMNNALLPSDILARGGFQGVAGYVDYKWNDKWLSSVRGEILTDFDGVLTGVRQNLREVTLTLGYTPIKSVEVRAEVRHDFSNVNAYLDTNGVTVNNNQQSYALEAYYKF